MAYVVIAIIISWAAGYVLGIHVQKERHRRGLPLLPLNNRVFRDGKG